MARTRRRRHAPSQDDKTRAELAIAELERSVKFLVTDYTVEFLAAKVRTEEYYVPAYQRELIWKVKAQSRFIESLVMGLPIPFLFLWQAEDGRLEIVDGSQRLRTIVRFLDAELRLKELELLPELNGFYFNDLERSRQRKLQNRAIRGIVLDNVVSETTRTEMFYRINTGGTKANDAEVRRGSLPGPFTDLVIKCSTNAQFEKMTPMSPSLIAAREREELVVRFFTYLERLEWTELGLDMPGWKDRPREYIWSYVAEANKRGDADSSYIDELEREFEQMLRVVDASFPYGFRKTETGKQIPRVRFEAIAVGTASAFRNHPELASSDRVSTDWIDDPEFAEVTTSDAANVKSKLLRRIGYVFERVTR